MGDNEKQEKRKVNKELTAVEKTVEEHLSKIQEYESTLAQEKENFKNLTQHLHARDQVISQQKATFEKSWSDNISSQDLEKSKLQNQMSMHLNSIDGNKSIISE